MKRINPYLTFNGNCREAMEFYQKCLGGVLAFQTIGESPMGEKMPRQMKACILHSTLVTDGLVIMGSDMVPETGIIKGNAVSFLVDCSSEEELRNAFNKLSANGVIRHQLETTFWGALFGDLTDKFGNHWMLNYNGNNYSQ
jgi:PhnB protein